MYTQTQLSWWNKFPPQYTLLVNHTLMSCGFMWCHTTHLMGEGVAANKCNGEMMKWLSLHEMMKRLLLYEIRTCYHQGSQVITRGVKSSPGESSCHKGSQVITRGVKSSQGESSHHQGESSHHQGESSHHKGSQVVQGESSHHKGSLTSLNRQ